MAWDLGGGLGVEEQAGVVAEVEECAADGGGADERKGAGYCGDSGGGSVGVESSVDEEEVGHRFVAEPTEGTIYELTVFELTADS